MNAATHIAMDLPRALTVRAFCALIASVIDDSNARTELAAAQLLRELDQTGTARIANDGNQFLSLTMFGIGATSHGDTVGLLRDWQHKALSRLANGVRR